MARLRANGTELLRTAKEITIADPDKHIIGKDGYDYGPSLTTWERWTRVYCASGKILQKHDVRFKPDSMDRTGRLYSYGWKVYGKMKPGHTMADLVAKTREIIARGNTSWKIENGGLAPVIISQKRIMEACESGDSIGFCKACGAEAYGVEPDARGYRCESCNQMEVYGAEEMLIAG
jgi:hypothetical protein